MTKAYLNALHEEGTREDLMQWVVKLDAEVDDLQARVVELSDWIRVKAWKPLTVVDGNSELDAARKLVNLWQAQWRDALDERNQLEARVAELEEVEREANFLLVWTHQGEIETDPEKDWHVTDLHPGVWNTMNSAEQGLYTACKKARAELEKDK